MARKINQAARRQGEKAALPATVKLSIRVTTELAQRLGVEASMRRVSQSSIIEEVLGAYLKRWRLPSTVNDQAGQAVSGEVREDSAA